MLRPIQKTEMKMYSSIKNVPNHCKEPTKGVFTSCARIIKFPTYAWD